MTRSFHTPYGVSATDYVDTIEAFKDHPALYGWYIADEPELFDDDPEGWPVVHRYLDIDPGYYHLAKQADPNHPTYITHNQEFIPADLPIYQAFMQVTDITGIHQYPFWRIC